MRSKIKVFFFCLTFSSAAHSQSLSISELHDLHNDIITFVSGQEKLDSRQRLSEFIICLLDVDSNGVVARINLLSDEKNKDSSFHYLNWMTPEAFKSRKWINCRNKTIMIPVLCLNRGMTPVYIADLCQTHSFKRVSIEMETDEIVCISTIQYSWPASQYPPPVSPRCTGNIVPEHPGKRD